MQNFMKTIISAVQTWTKREIKDSTADWNENDSGADSYVKNRTHWMENHITHMHIDECVFDGFIESGKGWYHTEYLNQPLSTTFEYNKTYTILWDGVEYQTTLRQYEDGCCFGHEYYMSPWDDTDLPFGINFKWDASTLTYVCSKTKESSHTLAIYEGHLIVKKLDRMYIDIPPNLATIYDVDDVKQETIDVVNAKMDADNPIGTGSFSMNRKSGTTVGDYSHAEGYDTTASGVCSHAEGAYTTASGDYSHAEGQGTTASGKCSHADGVGTMATRAYQHVYGMYNIEDTEGTATTRGKYAHVVGNGLYKKHSNAHTLDWNGVGWYQGGLQVGGYAQDDGAKNVLLEGEAIPVPAIVTVGQTIVVKSVDENGRPTEWEAVDPMVITSSTEGSNKKFKITVDDTGTLTVTEMIEQ